ncbi:MAG: hypothetical protein LBK72_11395 [Bifidobacteriaceae bacterium]|nr:hypothetical protein [Bifidobacteriaceae bacterium]
MQMFDRRVHVLFSQSQYRALEAAARDQSRSIGSLVREAVDQMLDSDHSAPHRAWNEFMGMSDASPSAMMTPDAWQRLKHVDQERLPEAVEP